MPSSQKKCMNQLLIICDDNTVGVIECSVIWSEVLITGFFLIVLLKSAKYKQFICLKRFIYFGWLAGWLAGDQTRLRGRDPRVLRRVP